MYKIIIKGEARTDYPYLSKLDGISCPEEFTEYFGKDEKSLIDKGVTNGYLRFEYVFEENKLYSVTTYNSNELLTPEEEAILIEYTQGQWSDGIGEGFEQEPCSYDEDWDVDRGIYISPWYPDQNITIQQIKI